MRTMSRHSQPFKSGAAVGHRDPETPLPMGILHSFARASFGRAWKMHVYDDCNIMLCAYGEHGTLQGVINSYLAIDQKMDELLSQDSPQEVPTAGESFSAGYLMLRAVKRTHHSASYEDISRAT
ncbi:hypothetical protein GOP47_0022748 [Adiantum capillus-veneris]|uniref:Uncharacterized protein n=1 Tax=Adiantum capillus-veneris TaxID=13818 RepID=A0A9D4U5Y7_ADICA|nr:hypothetical protein GOP47_0022748 [Adiantum capillus-veneris]